MIVVTASVATLASTGSVAPATRECPVEGRDGPNIPSRQRSLDGRLVYHNGIRQWYELVLDRPTCGRRALQLFASDDDAPRLDVWRGCRVRTEGPLGIPVTGYYSAALFQDVERLSADAGCTRRPRLATGMIGRPEPSIRTYRVRMRVDYRPGDHPVVFTVTNGGGRLSPWRAYAGYGLTGGFVLYGHCGEGFVIDRVFGTPAARPGHADDPRSRDDLATFDPETAAAHGVTDLRLGWTCVRSR